MTALSGPRATPEMAAIDRVLPVAANVKCWQGGLAILVGTSVKPGVVVSGGLALGRFEETVDNTGGAAGAKSVKVRRGCFKFGNYVSDAVPASQVGRNCYVYDDATVAATDGGSGARSVAGIVHQVDSDGVWVRF